MIIEKNSELNTELLNRQLFVLHAGAGIRSVAGHDSCGWLDDRSQDKTIFD